VNSDSVLLASCANGLGREAGLKVWDQPPITLSPHDPITP